MNRGLKYPLNHKYYLIINPQRANFIWKFNKIMIWTLEKEDLWSWILLILLLRFAQTKHSGGKLSVCDLGEEGSKSFSLFFYGTNCRDLWLDETLKHSGVQGKKNCPKNWDGCSVFSRFYNFVSEEAQKRRRIKSFSWPSMFCFFVVFSL